MAGLIDRIGPVKLRPRRLPPFQSLTHAVIHQQLSGQAAGTILGRFRALFGDDGFPTPEAVLKASPDRLRSAGLSRPKASYVLGIAQKAVDGQAAPLTGLNGHGGGFRRRRYKENRLMLNFRVIPVQFCGQLLGPCLFEALCAGADCTGDRRGPMNGVIVRTTRIWEKSISWNNSGRFCVLCFHRCSLARAVPCTTGGSGFKPRRLRRKVRNGHEFAYRAGREAEVCVATA